MTALNKTFAALAALLMFGALILPGCGDSDDPADDPVAAADPADPVAAADPADPVDPADPADPAPAQDIVAVAAGSPDFETLVAAVKAAGLVETLQGEGPFTVFAPTNAAFEKLPEGTVEELLKPENKEQLTAILTYHVVSGKVMAADVVNLTEATTVQGEDVEIRVEGETVKVNDATVTATDIEASNGVIHVIDTVIMPPNAQ